jgi:hypothetical protein
METVYILDASITQVDLDNARKFGIKDICFSANAIIARALSIVRQNEDIKCLQVPRICQTCLMDALKYALKREGRSDVLLQEVPFSHPAIQINLPKTNQVADELSDKNVLYFGLVGNPLLVFDAFLNDGIAKLLAELNVKIIWPDSKLLDAEDVRYIDQLEIFYSAGIRDVIYLQSFSCLKGHTMARGALHSLAQTFPGLSLTVIDYDPESSALNRENRIRLAVEQAKNPKCHPQE